MVASRCHLGALQARERCVPLSAGPGTGTALRRRALTVLPNMERTSRRDGLGVLPPGKETERGTAVCPQRWRGPGSRWLPFPHGQRGAGSPPASPVPGSRGVLSGGCPGLNIPTVML